MGGGGGVQSKKTREYQSRGSTGHPGGESCFPLALSFQNKSFLKCRAWSRNPVFPWAALRGGRKGKDTKGHEEPQSPSACTAPGKDLMGFENRSIILCGSSIVLMSSPGTCDHHAHCADGETEARKGQGAWCLPCPISGARSKPESLRWLSPGGVSGNRVQTEVTGIICWLRAQSHLALEAAGEAAGGERWRKQAGGERGRGESTGDRRMCGHHRLYGHAGNLTQGPLRPPEVTTGPGHEQPRA